MYMGTSHTFVYDYTSCKYLSIEIYSCYLYCERWSYIRWRARFGLETLEGQDALDMSDGSRWVGRWEMSGPDFISFINPLSSPIVTDLRTPSLSLPPSLSLSLSLSCMSDDSRRRGRGQARPRAAEVAARARPCATRARPGVALRGRGRSQARPGPRRQRRRPARAAGDRKF